MCYTMTMTHTILQGDVRSQLATINDNSIRCCVTSPPYFGLRDYGMDEQIGLERDPDAFRQAYAADNQALRQHILKARKQLDKVQANDDLLRTCAALCQKLGTDGLRAELTLMRASRAYAALQGKKTVTTAHLRQVAPMALRHRLRNAAPDQVLRLGDATIDLAARTARRGDAAIHLTPIEFRLITCLAAWCKFRARL